MRSIIVEREDLYREIWSRPLTHVARDYGISDVGLAKACKRMGIPRPPVGYWAKREAGREPEVPPLPPLSGKMKPAVEVRASKRVPTVDLLPEPEISVPARLRDPHPLVKLTRDELRGAGVDDYGRVSPRDSKGLEIRVSPGQLTRSLRVAEGLIRGLEKLGYMVELRNRWNQRFETSAVIDGEAVRFSIWEPSRRSVKKSDGSRWSYDRYVYTPLGDLELRIDEYVSVSTSKSIRDRPTGQRVEGALGRFVVSLHAVAQVMISEREEREIEEQKRQAELRERRKAERRVSYQGWLGRELALQASAYQHANAVRTFIAAVGRNESRTGEQMERWLQWARLEADRLDPLMSDSSIAQPLEPPDDWQPPGENQHLKDWERRDPLPIP